MSGQAGRNLDVEVGQPGPAAGDGGERTDELRMQVITSKITWGRSTWAAQREACVARIETEVQNEIAIRQRNSTVDDWHQTLTLAANFAANCHTAYRAASETAKKHLNHAMFARITLRDGHIDRWELPSNSVQQRPTKSEWLRSWLRITSAGASHRRHD